MILALTCWMVASTPLSTALSRLQRAMEGKKRSPVSSPPWRQRQAPLGERLSLRGWRWLAALDTRQAIEVGIPGVDLQEATGAHKGGVVGIGKGDVVRDVQV